jgi:cytochrome c peroxidase
MFRKLFLLSIIVVALIPIVYSQHTRACPIDIPDRPELAQHIEQDDIVNGSLTFDEVFEQGRILFITRFNRCDGQGRPSTTGTGDHREPEQPTFSRISSPDSTSCAGCHNQPRVGGAGDFVANVFVLGQAADPVLDSTSAEFSNSRNTLGMFGSGPIEMLAREMTADLIQLSEEAIQEAIETDKPVTQTLDTKGVNFGIITTHPDGTVDSSEVQGIDADLIIRPFHQAGVVVSLREFTVNAMNHHHGMQAEERFDLNPEKGNPDYDGDGVERELTIGDITAITIWQATLGTPDRVLPTDPDIQASVELGEELFEAVRCTSCHIPELYLDSCLFTEPNPYNPVGTFSDQTQSFEFNMCQDGESPGLEMQETGTIIRAYTDLKRHSLCDDPGEADAIRFYCNEQLAQDRPDQDGKNGAEFFITRKLWDVGNSAPYGHHGNLTTIAEAILMHGGEARDSRDRFVELTYDEQLAIVDFLRTLQVVPNEN